jgi:hypothetical protein
MAAKQDRTGLYLLILIFFLLRLYKGKKKGIGTTLFGVGTVLDLSKPIEDISDFIKAVKEEEQRGYTGYIKPKGIYYQLKAGDQIATARHLLSTDCPQRIKDQFPEVVDQYSATQDLKLSNPKMIFTGSIFPPILEWTIPGAAAEMEVVQLQQEGGQCTVEYITKFHTTQPLDYSRFKKVNA